jgi:hypothetical protein
MKYKNLNHAYLIEIFIGFGCIISIGLIGSKGLIALVLIGLRPFLLDKERIADEKSFWQFNYKVITHTLIITSMFIFLYYIISYFNPSVNPVNDRLLLLQLIPFFLLTHGVVGLVIHQTTRRRK